MKSEGAVRHKGSSVWLWVAVWCALATPGSAERDLKCQGLNSTGTTVPAGDIAVKVGSPVEVFCILNADHAIGYNSSQLRFYRDSKPVDDAYVSVINDTTLRLYIRNTTLSSSMYYCKLHRSGGEPESVCLNKVIVGKAPQAVTNFTCLSRNWSNLTCTWHAPPTYVITNYLLAFFFNSRSGRATHYYCPNVTMDTDTGEYSCYWDITTTPPYRESQPYYYFQLKGNNVFGEYQEKHSFNHFANMKPSQPENLTAVGLSAHGAQLRWELPATLANFPPGIVHRLMWIVDVDNEWRTANTSALPLHAKHHTFNLTGLPFAFYRYGVRVMIRSAEAPAHKYLWSEWASVHFSTAGERPTRPPLTVPGAFEVTASLDHRNVTLYWEQLEKYEENDDDFRYEVQLVIEGAEVRRVSSPKGYIVLERLPFQALSFTVTSRNRMGAAAEGSRLMVPPHGELTPEPLHFTKTALGNGTYELSWEAPKMNLSLLEGYTFFWCDHIRDRPYQCEGRLKWETLPPNVTSKNFNMKEDKIYQFAISANGRDAQSGMVWASCTIIPNKAIGKIKEVWGSKVNSTSLELHWKLECEDRVGVIKGYRIFYCPIFGLRNESCREPIKNFTVMKRVKDTLALLVDLRPYTTYAIKVSIIANHEVGPQSDSLLISTLEAAPEPPVRVSYRVLNNSAIIVQWSPPLRMNGMLVNYYVDYRAEGAEKHTREVARTEPTRYLLRDLDSFTNYTIGVRACTVDCSAASIMHARTDIGPPGLVMQPALLPPSAAEWPHHRLRWWPPSRPGGSLDFYQIRLLKMRRDGNLTTVVNATETDYLIPEQLCKEENVLAYVIDVRAINYKRPQGDGDPEALEGPWSDPAQNWCTPASSSGLLWIIIVPGLAATCLAVWLASKACRLVQRMSSIKPIMPDGLFPEQEREKEAKHPLGDWKPPAKHKERPEPRPATPAAPSDEVSLLSAPNTASASLSSRRAPSPALSPPWPGFTPSDEYASDPDVAPTIVDTPYVSFATERPTIGDGYVQASILPKVFPELPPTTSPARTAPPQIALVKPYITIDDPRIAAAAQSPVPEIKMDKGGYVKHQDLGYVTAPPPPPAPAPDMAAVPLELAKRISVPLLNTKSDTEDKRLSLKYSTLGMEMSGLGLREGEVCSPEYCRFGWNSPEGGGGDDECPPPIRLGDLDKEEYRFSLEELMPEVDEASPTSTAQPSHYLPLNIHSHS